LYSGRRELFQAWIVEYDLEVLTFAPQMNVGAIEEVATSPACFVEASGDGVIENR
jgi:hypothetical protein